MRVRRVFILLACALIAASCGDDNKTRLQQVGNPATTTSAGQTTTTVSVRSSTTLPPESPRTCTNEHFTVTLPQRWYTNRDDRPSGACIAFAENVKPELLVDGMFRRPEGELDLTGYPIAIKYEPTWDIEGTIAGVIQSNRGVRPTVERAADGTYKVSDISSGIRVETVTAEGRRPSAVVIEVETKGELLGAADGRVQLYRIVGHPAGGVLFVWSDLGNANDVAATRSAFDAISSSIEIR